MRPRLRAASRPALLRSAISARSSCATAPSKQPRQNLARSCPGAARHLAADHAADAPGPALGRRRAGVEPAAGHDDLDRRAPARIERDEQAGLSDLGLRLAEAKQLTSALQAEIGPAQVTIAGSRPPPCMPDRLDCLFSRCGDVGVTTRFGRLLGDAQQLSRQGGTLGEMV